MKVITKDSYKKLEEKLDYLRNVARPEVQEELAAARAMGDLSENADYDAARTKQSEIEMKIIELEEQIRTAQIVDAPADNSSVQLNTVVTFYDEDEKEECTYTIGDSVSSNPDEHIISNECPLGKALMNHKVGETVQVKIAVPYNVTIRKIESKK